MRLGRVEYSLGYIVDLDNEEMVQHAKDAIFEDIQAAIKQGQFDWYFEIIKDEGFLTEADIPDFLKEEANEKEEDEN